MEGKHTCILHEQILNQPAMIFFFFNYTFFKITSFRTSSQKFSPHDCKFLLEPWKGCKEKTECQRFPCNHSYFLLWKLPIFVVSRERIAEDFYLSQNWLCVFKFIKFRLLKKTSQQQQQKKNIKITLIILSVHISESAQHLCLLGGNTAHCMLAFTVKCYKLKSNSGRILWG